MLEQALAYVVRPNGLSTMVALLAFAGGIRAAWKWFEASRIVVDLGYAPPGTRVPGTFKRGGLELTRFTEPVDGGLRQMNEIAATWEAMTQASNLNKTAAVWTAISVLLSATSAILNAFG